MRFTQGCKVEVFSKREVITGSWRPAEIISGDGRNYTVKYDKFNDEPVIGWVSGAAIRPRPPLESCNWSSGEFVEVFDNFSWKVGTILKRLGKKKILVQLHGSLVNRIVNLNEIRVRHSWEDGTWTVMGKSVNSEDGKYSKMGNGLTHKLKNSSLYFPTECKWEYSAGAPRKYRHVEKGCQTYRVMENLSTEPANMMASQCHKTSKKRGQSSLVIRFPVRPQRSESSQSVDSFSSVRSDSNDEDSDLCSVGSCSTTDSWSQFNHYGPTPTAGSNGDVSDAQSSCAPSHDEHYITLESLQKAAAAAAEIHQLELQGYRRTLKALHASGPLSWEQQSLISNLRLSLNISNDEHLMEVKSLLSR